MKYRNKAKKNSFNLDNIPGIYPKHFVPQLVNRLIFIFKDLPETSDSKKAINKYAELLEYYYHVSDRNSPVIQYALTFCTDIKKTISEYIKAKYPEYDIDIAVKGRIKSPISASNKFRAEIAKCIKNRKNLDELKIKDLFAFRIIVTVKDKNGTILGDDIAIPITYDVVEQAIEYSKEYQNVKVNKSKERSNKDATILYDNVVVPKERSKYIEEHEQLGDFKDYIKYPKKDSNYQSVHSKLEINLPNSQYPLLLEMQIRTYHMNEHAERGPASHSSYKSRKTISFSRVPQIFEELEDGTLDFISMEQSFKEFYNVSLADIDPNLTIASLEDFLNATEYKCPIGIVTIAKVENGIIKLANEQDYIIEVPVELVDKVSNEELIALATNMFERSKDIELDEK